MAVCNLTLASVGKMSAIGRKRNVRCRGKRNDRFVLPKYRKQPFVQKTAEYRLKQQSLILYDGSPDLF